MTAATPDIPAPPGGMLPTTVEAWELFWGGNLAGLVDRKVHMTPLIRLFEMYDDRQRFRSAVKRRKFVKGSTGQPVANPMFDKIEKLDSRIIALEDRFGISPLAAAKLGVSFADAKRHLDELNREEYEDGDRDEDPRSQVIDVASSD